MTSLERAATLEAALGAPLDADNPLGLGAVLDADEQGALLPAGVALLDRLGVISEFVPAELGGRLEGIETLVRTLRPVFRRDVSLGLGYGASSFVASCGVWLAGSADQRGALARALLRGGQVATVGQRDELRASVTGDTAVIDGRQAIVENAARASIIVALARTSDTPGERTHSMLLLDAAALRGCDLAALPRERMVGIRGCDLSGVAFRGCRTSLDTLLGELGDGLAITRRAAQIARITVPGMGVGALDTALRTTLRFALERRLYDTTVAELPHARRVLVDAFADLLVCDALSLAAARSVRVLPRESFLAAAATGWLVPRIIIDAISELSIVLGARFYLRDGEHAILEKLVRDAPALGFGQATAACGLAELTPSLRALAQTVWGQEAAAPAGLLCDDSSATGGLSPDVPAPGGVTGDALFGQLRPALGELLAYDGLPPIARTPAALLTQAASDLQRDCAVERRDDAAGGFALAERYTILIAAAACAGSWRAHAGTPDGFLSSPAWALAGLRRLVLRLGGHAAPLDNNVERDLFAELLRRHDAGHSFDLDGTSVSQ